MSFAKPTETTKGGEFGALKVSDVRKERFWGNRKLADFVKGRGNPT